MTDKIMPVLGCLEHRRYIEKYLEGQHSIDPCLTCEKRSGCIKSTVVFGGQK